MITTTATNPALTAASDFVFMAAFTDAYQGAVMARFGGGGTRFDFCRCADAKRRDLF